MTAGTGTPDLTELKGQKVLVVGTWHLGSVVGACLADVGQNVSLWDQSPSVTAKWRGGQPPIHEPGLEEMVRKHWGLRLRWVDSPTQFKNAAHEAQWIVIAYDTPISQHDDIILTSVEEGFAAVLKSGFSDRTNFFFTSQLPAGTSRKFRLAIAKTAPRWKGHVVYQPENLRLGEAIKSFTAPDRMVLGLDDTAEPAKTETVNAFQGLLQNTKTPLNIMNLESAEMVKHALNSFLATCVVFANEVSEICEGVGADGWDVMASLKQDSRVGPKAFLRPGLGFAGGTLARDVKTLSKLSRKEDAENFFSDLYLINNLRNNWVIHHLKDQMRQLKDRKIVLLGVTYKPGTSTVRRSPALDIAKLLTDEGATVVAIDPMADLNELTVQERKTLPFTMETSAEKAFDLAYAAVIVTEWPQFRELNWPALKEMMQLPLIIDSKGLLSKGQLKGGFTHIVPGKP